MSTPSPCPRCGRPMDPGWLYDGQQDLRRQARWVEGSVEATSGLLGLWTEINIGKARHWPVTGLRCTGCGYLELFANDPAPAAGD